MIPRRECVWWCGLVVLMVCGPFGCSPSPRVGHTPYYPLQVGNEWTYRGAEHKRTLRVHKHDVIDGVACALVQTLHDGEVKAEEHIQVTENGVFGLTSGGEKLPKPFPLLRLPPKDGRTWSVRITKNGEQSRIVHVVGRDTVEVPAGKFHAITLRGDKYILRSRNKPSEGTREHAFVWWLAKDVGIVKQQFTSAERQIVYELVKYKVGN